MWARVCGNGGGRCWSLWTATATTTRGWLYGRRLAHARTDVAPIVCHYVRGPAFEFLPPSVDPSLLPYISQTNNPCHRVSRAVLFSPRSTLPTTIKWLPYLDSLLCAVSATFPSWPFTATPCCHDLDPDAAGYPETSRSRKPSDNLPFCGEHRTLWHLPCSPLGSQKGSRCSFCSSVELKLVKVPWRCTKVLRFGLSLGSW